MPDKPDPSLTLESLAAGVAKWRPVVTKEGQLLEITLVLTNPTPEDLELLWASAGYSCALTLTFAGRQIRMG